MTIVAVDAAGDMGRVFAGRRNTIVTRAATAENVQMIDPVHRRPDIGVMAIFTDVSGLYMS